MRFAYFCTYMVRRISCIACFCLLGVSQLNAQLAGTYTVGNHYHLSDFKTLQEVSDTIMKSGISGAVTIKLLPDSNIYGFSLNYIPGANAINRLIIESFTGDPGSAVIRGNGADYVGVVNLTDAAFLTFRSISVINESITPFSGNMALTVYRPCDVVVEDCHFESKNTNGNVPDEHCCIAVNLGYTEVSTSFTMRNCEVISGTHAVAAEGGGEFEMEKCWIESSAEYSLWTSATHSVTIRDSHFSGDVYAHYNSYRTEITGTAVHGNLDVDGNVVLDRDSIGDNSSSENLFYDGAEITNCVIHNPVSYYGDGGFITGSYLGYLHLWAGGSQLLLSGNVLEETEIVNQSQIEIEKNVFKGDAFITCSGPGRILNNYMLADFTFLGNDYTIAYNNFDSSVEVGYAENNFYNNNLKGDISFTPDASHTRNYNNYYPGINTSELHAFHIDPMYVSSSDLHIQNTALEGLDTLLLTVEDDFDGDKREGHSAIGADAICFPDSFTPMEDITVTCGDSVYLTPVSCSGAAFQWIAVSGGDTLHIADPLVNPYHSDTYLMNAGDECGHLHVDTVQVSIIPFQIQASYSPPAYCGIAELLTSSYLPSYTYHWEPVNYVSAPASYITYAAASDTVVYKVTAEKSMCGVSEDSLTVPITNTVSASFNVDVYSNAALFHNMSTFPAWYVWDFGDGTQSLELNPTHYYSQYTWYYVTLTVTNSCGESDTVSEWVNYNSGIAEEGTDARISISGNPNPFINQLALIIKNDEQCDGTVRLLTMYGQEVYVFTIESMKEQRFDIAADNLDSGVYVVLLKLNDGKSLLKRIVKQ